eukprot:8033235-Pyramimonas_sp.AAC.1
MARGPRGARVAGEAPPPVPGEQLRAVGRQTQTKQPAAIGVDRLAALDADRLPDIALEEPAV